MSFILLLGMVAHAHALTVSDIRIGIHDQQTRFVVDLSGPADYRIFLLTDPERVVIDLPKFKWNAGVKNSDPTGLINDYRHGQFNPQTSRIVLDVKQPLIVADAFTLPPSDGRPYRLVMDLKPVSERMFHAALDDVIGSKKPPAPIQNQPQKQPIIAASPIAMKKPLIVIDAGHGGKDPGAIAGNGIREKNITLAAAKSLRDSLQSTGRYDVVLTRDTDIYHQLRKRYQIARKKEANLFISLHADSMPKKNVTGASVYTLSNTASDKETAKLAEQENKSDAIAGFDLSHEDADVADILIDLTVRDTMNQSKIFADMVVASFNANGVKTLSTPHRFAGFAVLKAPDTPSVLIEMGFLSSPVEAGRLNTPAYRKKLANAIRDAIDLYFKEGVSKTVF